MRYRLTCADGDCCFSCWAGSPDLVEALVNAHSNRTAHRVLIFDEHPESNDPGCKATGQGGTGATERRPS